VNEVVEFLNVWPLNRDWYWPAMLAVLVLLVPIYVLLGVLRRRAEQQSPSKGMSTAEIRRLRGHDG
jgi:type VI protein secretion system component VasK